MLTASDDSRSVKSALRLGAADYFLKRAGPQRAQGARSNNRYYQLRCILHGVLLQNGCGKELRELGRRCHQVPPLCFPNDNIAGCVNNAFHQDTRLQGNVTAGRMSCSWNRAVKRHLMAAWGCLARVEPLERRSLFRSVLLGQALVKALSCGNAATGPATWFYVECGCVLELLATTLHGCQHGGPQQQDTLRQRMRNLADRLRQNQLVQDVWDRRNMALHNGLEPGAQELESLILALEEVVTAVEQFVNNPPW